ncbi:MAG: hypothetical protein AAF437_05695 [Pseudomonadota bacterium]
MQRLLNILQRGGVAAARKNDSWGVWRGRDRRRRCAGTIAGHDIDLLRWHDYLTFDPSSPDELLVWRGDDACNGAERTVACALEDIGRLPGQRALLDGLILAAPTPVQRRYLVDAAGAVRRDLSEAADSSEAPHTAAAVCGRLTQIVTILSAEDCRFLHQLIVGGATRSDLSTRFALRPDAAQSKAIGILREVCALYENGRIA